MRQSASISPVLTNRRGRPSLARKDAVFTGVLCHIPFGAVFVLKRLGQFEIIENRRIAEHDQDGAAILRRKWTVRRHRLGIEFRAHWI